MKRSGFDIVVTLVDHNDRDENDEPQMYQSRQHYTNYQVAQTDTHPLVERTLRHTIHSVINAMRAGGDRDDD